MANNGILSFLLVCLLVVAGGGYLEYEHRRQQADSRPVEGGVIEVSDVGMTQDGTARLALRYRYTVDGQQYTSTNVCPGVGDAGCYGAPEDVAARYPEGSTVTVYVDPDDPSESFLLKDDDLTAGGLWAIAGVGFALFGIVGWLRQG